MNLDTITVVVPTRNERHNIPTFLASLPPDVSLVVVDASTDDTPTVIESLRPRHTRVICQPSNVTEARCIGADAATTEWLLFTDADITFAPDYFATLAARPNDSDALYGPKLSRDAFRYYYKFFSWGMRLIHNAGIPAVSGSNLLVKRSVYHAIGGFDLSLTVNEDSELGWRVPRQGYRIDFDPALKVYARDHRRLERGRFYKTAHSLVRCGLLYFNLMPKRWRSRDWGYWKPQPQKSRTTSSKHSS